MTLQMYDCDLGVCPCLQSLLFLPTVFRNKTTVLAGADKALPGLSTAVLTALQGQSPLMLFTPSGLTFFQASTALLSP